MSFSHHCSLVKCFFVPEIKKNYTFATLKTAKYPKYLLL